MENSFFEYRNDTVADSGSESEFIDNSLSIDDSFAVKKKSHTIVVAESEESTSDDESESYENISRNAAKSVVKRSNVVNSHVIPSSDDDSSRRGSIRRQSESSNKVVMSSSDEDDQASPEMVPKRRPLMKKQSSDSNHSFIGRKTKKRVMQLNSDTDNSLIIEQSRNKKLQCLKDTPLKIASGKVQLNESSMLYENDNSLVDDDVNDSNVNDDGDVNDSNVNDNSGAGNDSKVNDDSGDVNDNNVNDDSGAVNDSKVNDEDDVNDDSEENESSDNTGSESDGNTEHVPIKKNTKSIEKSDDDSDVSDEGEELGDETDDDEGPDEDQMVMSRATRMSIMGVVPKGTDDDDDDSDFIQSDEGLSCDVFNVELIECVEKYETSVLLSSQMDEELLKVCEEIEDELNTSEQIVGRIKRSAEILSNEAEENSPKRINIALTPSTEEYFNEESRPNSNRSSAVSLTDLPEVSHLKSPEKPQDTNSVETTRLTCSPFSSPLQDITNETNNRFKKSFERQKCLDDEDCTIVSDSGFNASIRNSSKKNTNRGVTKENFIKYDDDVTIIDSKPEIIALSSDDEDEAKSEKVSPSRSPKSPKSKKEEGPERPASQNIKQYLLPQSYPNQQVVYVKKHVRETELLKLEALKEDLKNIRYLLEEMDVQTLPDGGSKLIERLSHLEQQVRVQGDKVANMIVEPDKPTAADIARDGFEKGLSWDEIQKASNAVQPRMFGKQAMATHMAERSLIMDRLSDLYKSLESRPADSAAVLAPRALAAELLPHQRHALAWLQWRETQRPRAGILADDMGLGKTITMISLILSDKEGKMDDGEDDDDDDDDDERPSKSKLIKGGTLVVCPASLIQQWGGEVKKHCKPHSLSVCLHHGTARAQQPSRLATNDLVVTTYNIMQRDKEKNGVLMRISWKRVILDEAHCVRNHKSATCGAASALRASRRWCLTGTPVQNRDLDLFALLKFLRCSPFDELTMWKKWIDNKSLGGQERLSIIMQCLLLRRTKAQLQQKGQLTCLPDKAIHQKHVTLTKAEMNVYQKVLVTSKTLFAQFLHQRAEKNADYQGFSSSKNTEYDKMHKRMVALQGVKPVKSHEILVLLLRLRQVCCHCGLIAAMLDAEGAVESEDNAGNDLLAELNKLSLDDAKQDNLEDGKEEEEGPGQEGATAAEAIRSVLSPNNPVFELTQLSSKIRAVWDCLQKEVFVHKGDKAVVVSQWTSVLRLVEQVLKREGIRSVTLSGNVPVPQRPTLINAINDPNSDVKVMLLSLCAGGVGLNLCGANHLLLLDPHWNPQLEEQAQDRIYRVGQKKNVNIYRFMCVDTVEQSIRKLQEAKLELANNVLTGAKNTNNSKLTIEDLKMLFNMGQ